jgi:MFS family permease
MSEKISLKQAERKAFQLSFADGLWDVLIGCFVLMFAIAPLLSERLGDFWSSMIFLPFWGLVYLAIWLVRRHIVSPRLGKVTYSKSRQQKLRRFSLVMVITNSVLLILGLIVLVVVSRTSGGLAEGRYSLVPAVLGFMLLLAFSLGAYLLDYPRLYVYGLLLFIAPILGEWLYQNQGVAHHGWPLVFGVAGGIIILVGIVTFATFLHNNPPIESQAQVV